MFPLSVLAIIITLNRSASMYVVQRWWSPVLLRAVGATLEILGLEQLDRNKPYVFVSNHQSAVDIPTLFMALPWDVRFVAKKALMYVPLIGWYMWIAKFLFVDRSNRHTALASLSKAAHQIRNGVSIIIFAEGTRSSDRTIKRFKKGSFILAMKAGVPLVPVTIEGTGIIAPKHSWTITPGPIKVLVGAPIDPLPFEANLEALVAAVRTKVIEQNLALGGLGGQLEARAAPYEATETKPTAKLTSS